MRIDGPIIVKMRKEWVMSSAQNGLQKIQPGLTIPTIDSDEIKPLERIVLVKLTRIFVFKIQGGIASKLDVFV